MRLRLLVRPKRWLLPKLGYASTGCCQRPSRRHLVITQPQRLAVSTGGPTLFSLWPSRVMGVPSALTRLGAPRSQSNLLASTYRLIGKTNFAQCPPHHGGGQAIIECPYCNRPLMQIDHYGEVLVGCIHCNRWGHPGDERRLNRRGGRGSLLDAVRLLTRSGHSFATK
jgi:hypothetical protein